MRKLTLAAVTLAAAAGAAYGQDSVPITPGTNDALSVYDASSQRVRYVVDAVMQTTSWGQPILVAPIIKASRDSDPLYKTQVLGSAAVSPTMLEGVTFPTRTFALWTSRGQGVNPTYNTPAGTSVPVTGFATQFAVAASDFSLNPSNAIGAIVGRDSADFGRLYVERVVAAVSRASSGAADTATLSYGSVDAAGNVLIRADNFNTLTTTASRVLGDNILRVSTADRNGAANSVSAGGAVNTATDTGATAFIVNNEPTPTNVPASVLQEGVGPFALVEDFSNRLRVGSSTADLTNLGAAHLGAGAVSQRGNPSYSPLTPLGGDAGTLATLALSAGGLVNTLDACGLNFGAAGAPPSVAPGTARALTLASPVSSPLGFAANATGAATFKQYLSQVPFRGGSGLVGVGEDSGARLVLAATANEAGIGDYIVAVTATGPATGAWTVAAFPGQQVLSGAAGPSIGTLASPAVMSAPAVDGLGNVYFVCGWTPTGGSAATGLFKGVDTGNGHRLELILTTGQTITGANSTRPYTITSLALSDSDSIASGAFHHQQLITEQSPGATTADPLDIRAMGGLIVNAVVTYDNNATAEPYDAVLLVSPTAETACAADFNNSGAVSVQDIFDFLAAYFMADPAADFNHSGAVSVQDIFDYLAAYFVGCP